MNINIYELIDGAKKATGLAVIIDVFRAFSLEAYLVHGGAARVFPVGDMQIAYDWKKRDPSVILAGERNGIKLPGFDYGNSPAETEHADLTGKIVVHTTSAGTQGLANAVHADEVLTGSLVNAKAIARYIKKSGREEVSLVAMGWNGETPTDEDALCARYIKSLLGGEPLDLAPEIEHLKGTNGAKFFVPENQSVFPARDFTLCTDADRFDFVLRLVRPENGPCYVERIDI